MHSGFSNVTQECRDYENENENENENEDEDEDEEEGEVCDKVGDMNIQHRTLNFEP